MTSGRPHLLVGLGASAGGLDAYREFFSRMPPDAGITCILVQHLDPDAQSALVSIIAGYTALPVELAAHGSVVRPDRVYVIPPDAIMTIADGILQLTSPAPPAARRTSINTFLSSLAADKGEDAVGIILSGFGSDGALGIADIKDHGGLTLSQAEYDHHAKSGMPQSATSGGFVDHVLPAGDMPAALVAYQDHRAECGDADGPEGLRKNLATHLPAICAVLNSRLGRDFSRYKAGTVTRRVQRRMHIHRLSDGSEYVELLRSSQREAELLMRELLISVTRFFRDREAFEALAASLPGLLAAMPAGDPVRAWVAGCATGEEAYTLAILLGEAVERSGERRSVQIFATDVDPHVIELARAGLYGTAIAADLTPERLGRDFIQEDGHFRVSRELRDRCLFSVHDLAKDPPFSRLDLVSCRNLLIYFETQLQARVLTTFHYALRPGRILMLGSSESVGTQQLLFDAVDKRHRLFVRRDVAASLPLMSLSPWTDGAQPSRRPAPHAVDAIDRRAARTMARYTPAFLVVDRHSDIIRFSGQTAKYLEPATGVASLNLFNLLHADLRWAARGALNQVATSGQRVIREAITITSGAGNPGQADAGDELVTLIVEPMPPAGEQELFLVAFQDAGSVPATTVSRVGESEASVHALERDLHGTRERLRDANEALEAAHEQLQLSNEKYLSVNEELQSANEELETSKQELQSLNEELQTINAELHQRNESLVRSSTDLANLFDSTAIATLFLDNEQRIRRFTPQVLDIFKVREGDEGRPITDIVARLTRDGLGDDVRHVLQTMTPIEREVTTVGPDVTYLMQVRPYRDIDGAVDGVVINFIDISERRRNEQARSQLAAIVESSQDAIVSHDLDGVVTSWNNGAEQLYGYGADEAIGRSLATLLQAPTIDDWSGVLSTIRSGDRIERADRIRTSKAGAIIDVSITVSPVRQANGRIVGGSVVARDISERKEAERRTALLLGELDHRVKNILAIVTAVVSQTLRDAATPEAFAADIEGRVVAIAKAHSLLTDSGHGELELAALIATELAPYDRGTGTVATLGPRVVLMPKAGLALAMALHELASNAAKYGALSTGNGRLDVAWTVAGSGETSIMTLQWSEAGGPAVRPPTRRGFGTTLIERALRHELDAEVTREFLPEGVRCRIVVPLTSLTGHVVAASGGNDGA